MIARLKPVFFLSPPPCRGRVREGESLAASCAHSPASLSAFNRDGYASLAPNLILPRNGGGKDRGAGAGIVRAGTRQGSRSGFTLLELLLSLAIGVILLGAVYVAVVNQVEMTQAGRRTIEEAMLARNLLRIVSFDIAGHVPPVLPAASTSSSSSPATSGSNASAQTAASSQTTTTTPPFNLGVQGDQNNLILSICTLPKEGLDPEILQSGAPLMGISDQRVIMYWLAPGDVAGGGGLARYEIKTVSSPDLLAQAVLPPNVPDEQSRVIAKEVKSLTFSYFDGSAWVDTWDGTQPGQDGVTPMGPPKLIKVTIGIASPNLRAMTHTEAAEESVKTYTRTVLIPTANGLNVATSASAYEQGNTAGTTVTGE